MKFIEDFRMGILEEFPDGILKKFTYDIPEWILGWNYQMKFLDPRGIFEWSFWRNFQMKFREESRMEYLEQF